MVSPVSKTTKWLILQKEELNTKWILKPTALPAQAFCQSGAISFYHSQNPFFPFIWCDVKSVCLQACACVCVCVCSHMSCISLKWPPLLPDHNNYSVLTRGCLCQQMESQAVILLESSSWFDGTCRTVNYGFISAKMYHFSLRLPPVSSVCLCVCMYA